jgi:hypothetical protein
MNVISPLEGIRQGMRVLDPAGKLVGHIRDVSGRAILIIEPGSTRVFWVEDQRVARVELGAVHLTTPIAAF